MSIRVEGSASASATSSSSTACRFDVADGEFVTLLGPSGCGKTTTLRCIAGLETPDAGAIAIGGSVVFDAGDGVLVPPHERNIGMVFQSYAIWPHMTVFENVAFPLQRAQASRRPRSRQPRRRGARAGRHRATCAERQPPSSRAASSSAWRSPARSCVEPEVLLLDEPLSNLDAKLREHMRAEFRRLQRELGITAVYVTHDQDEALSMSDRVVVMEGGRIVQAGAPKELYRYPANRFVADFVGRASFIDVRKAPDGRGWLTPSGVAIALEGGENGDGRYQAMLRPEAVELTRGTMTPERGRPPERSHRGRALYGRPHRILGRGRRGRGPGPFAPRLRARRRGNGKLRAGELPPRGGPRMRTSPKGSTGPA